MVRKFYGPWILILMVSFLIGEEVIGHFKKTSNIYNDNQIMYNGTKHQRSWTMNML